MRTPQRHWDARAALNFILGGSGAGLMVAAAFVPLSNPYPILLSLVLVAAGLTSVWLETGKKLRALHVLFNPFTSWMTRESFAALLFFPLAFGSVLTLKFAWAAAIAALAFLWCQARLLRAARGIPAWRAPQIVPLIVSTGLAEGAGLCLLFTQDAVLMALVALALVARAVAWLYYRTAVRQPVLEAAGKALLQLGTALPLALLVFALFVPEAAFVAGIAAAASGGWLKFVLVTRASFTQGFALPRLPVRGTR